MKEELIEKYNVPVPRYTSYPPANYFSTDFTAADYEKAIADSDNMQPEHISIYIHIPFCRHLCYYCGCNSFAMMNNEWIKRYIDAVKKEIMMVLPRLSKHRKVAQIHYGGGSPTSIPIHYLKSLNELILSHFHTIENPEIAVECHPGYLSLKDWEELSHAGFTRFSLGIQDFDEKVLKCANRRSSLIPAEEIVDILHSVGAGVNMDFIYGLPHQSIESFSESIKRAAAIRPERIVTFSYAHVPWVNKLMLILEKEGLPDNELKAGLFDAAKVILHQAGYRSIGLDHFVRPEDELYKALENHQLHRNFQGYCTRRTTGQVYAFGVTAISQLSSAYTQNIKEIRSYIDCIESGHLAVARGYKLNSDEQITSEVIASIMCNGKVSWSYIASQLGISAEQVRSATAYNEKKLRAFASDGIISFDEDSITINPEFTFFSRSVAASLDKLMIDTDKIFSKPI